MKKITFLLIVSILIKANGIGQTKTGIELCVEYQKAFSAFTSEKEANVALDKILDVIGASKNFTLIPCDDISNAVAVTFKGDRFILFDGAFMRKINQATNNWSYLFILAHEVGHHINGHTRDFLLATVLDDQSLEDRRKEELEADEFASFVVSKLGASYSQIEETIDLIASNEIDLYSTHPNYDKRIAAVKRGFERAYSGSGSSNSYSSNNNKKNTYTLDEITLKLDNPRKPVSSTFGKWHARKQYDLENVLSRTEDPFKRKEYEGWIPIKQLNSTTPGKSLSPYGSKQVQLSVTIMNMNKNYKEYSVGEKKYYFHTPKTSYSIALYGWEDAPKEIKYSDGSKTYATFEYIIDGKYSGQFVGIIGWMDWYFDENYNEIEVPRKVPIEVNLNDWHYKFQQKENYEFINRLKAGKKLYLRFGKLFNWNGYKNGQAGNFDTSDVSNKYTIPRYTYEFDLTGSSKALSF